MPRRFSALSRAKRALLLRAIPTVALVRLELWLLHSSYVLRRVENSITRSQNGSTNRRGASVAEIAWAIRAASRRVPGATCLVQALAARLLFASHGYGSTLRVGVARAEGEDLAAHAWLEVEGRPVIGNQDLHRYSVFPDVSSALPVSPKRFKSGPARGEVGRGHSWR